MNVKKKRERYFLNAAISASAIFPAGKIVDDESPDFVINANCGKIGIEVRELFPPQGKADFPLQQAESFHEKTICMAEALFQNKGRADVDVIAYFENDCRRRSIATLAQLIADFVEAKSQSGQFDTFSGHENGFPSGIMVLRIAKPLPGIIPIWRCLKHGGAIRLEQNVLAEAIAEKEKLRFSYYRKSDQTWLLLIAPEGPLTTFWIPSEISSWRFTCGFERILLFDHWNSKLIELSRS
jgi:hypothetical protein